MSINNDIQEMATERGRDAFIVASFPSGEGPFKARDVYYTIEILHSRGVESHELVVPSNRRPNVDIYPARPGEPIVVVWAGNGDAHFIINEQVAFDNCPGATP